MKFKILIASLLASLMAFAQEPANYYASAYNKKGYALRSALHQIIKNHTTLTYNSLWGAFQSTDINPNNGKIWDIYSYSSDTQASYYFTYSSDQCGSYSSEGDCYNREHSVPKSWFNDQSPMVTDLFHIYPTDGFVNGKRGNLPLGEVSNATWTSSNGSKLGNCTVSGYSNTVFEPNDNYKGDLARSYFYMCVCYMDKNLGCESQSMFNNGSLKPWALQMLINWHNADPVSQKEIARNNAVYALQHNRNPFIDHPELVGKIFGTDSVNAFHPIGLDDWQQADNWLVLPNPASEHISIIVPEQAQGEATAQIINLAGVVLFQQPVTLESRIDIQISDLPTGIYFLRIANNDFILTKKVVKQ